LKSGRLQKSIEEDAPAILKPPVTTQEAATAVRADPILLPALTGNATGEGSPPRANLQYRQALLSHNSRETTIIYTHIPQEAAGKLVSSPDRMGRIGLLQIEKKRRFIVVHQEYVLNSKM
jgi:hypothetical protein